MYPAIYRHLLLPLFDRVIKGRSTLSHWRAAEQSQWLPRAELEARQVAALRSLVAHAMKTCPRHRERLEEAGVRPEAIQSFADFSAVPLLTKEEIRRNRLALRSTTFSKLMSKATGGSSGEPLHFDLNSDSNDRRTAMMHRGYGWAGAHPGTRQLFVWGSHVGKTPLWKQWKAALHHRIENHLILSCFEFSPDRMRGHFDRMNAFRADHIVAYTNPLYEFARYIERTGLTPHRPKSIIVGAEKLHPFQRETIERVFGAPVFETYGSREFMLIGAECDRHSGLHLSLENLCVEVLDDDGRPTPDGEEGNVVITDLYNYGMPFLRYVNGDRAIAGFTNCSCGRGLPLLRQVTGRRLDTLETPDGRAIPGEFFPHLLKEFRSIRRFQVVQTSPGSIELKLVAEGGLTVAEHELLVSEIRRVAGDAVELKIHFVDDIPLTRAGKLSVVVRQTTGAAASPVSAS